ncbi:hypothetical protein BM221_007219 [Beauveria bassiana]|uniref:Uncharacterized protein n=1 Tax=Beauveria bassiana TaxID=176275 RepID=A0A2N6NJV3_BEABA|nr:hypothetical protein BM221_007219 [Beauveria bassiana]
MANEKERAKQIAAKFGVEITLVHKVLNGAAVTTWNLLVKASDPLPPWEAFVKELNENLSAGQQQPRRGPIRGNGAPSSRQVRYALSAARQQSFTPSETHWPGSGGRLLSRKYHRTGKNSGNQRNENSSPTPQHLRARMEIATATDSITKASLPARQVLRQVEDLIIHASAMMNGVQPPAAVFAEKMEKIVTHLENSFQRYGSPALAESNKKAIRDDIIRHAGEKRMLEENGLQDAENAHETQLVAVLTTFLSQVNTLVGPVVKDYTPSDPPQIASAPPESVQSPTLCCMDGPEPAHNGACPSSGDTRQIASSERRRRGSSKVRDRQYEAENGESIVVASNHRDEGDPPPQVQAADQPSLLEYSDAESQSGASVVWEDWRIGQIKTAQFTSPIHLDQCWSWEEENGCLVYRVKRQGPSEWVAPSLIRFDVMWKDVKEIEVSKESWRAKVILKESLFSAPEDRVVMVVFDGKKTVQRFTDFCLHKRRKVTRLEPPTMVNLWRAMESQTVLPDIE